MKFFTKMANISGSDIGYFHFDIFLHFRKKTLTPITSAWIVFSNCNKYDSYPWITLTSIAINAKNLHTAPPINGSLLGYNNTWNNSTNTKKITVYKKQIMITFILNVHHVYSLEPKSLRNKHQPLSCVHYLRTIHTSCYTLKFKSNKQNLLKLIQEWLQTLQIPTKCVCF